jgi:hypothetical protein
MTTALFSCFIFSNIGQSLYGLKRNYESLVLDIEILLPYFYDIFIPLGFTPKVFKHHCNILNGGKNLNFTLSMQQKQLRRMARQFARAELAPIAKEIDDEGRFPWEVVEKMGPLNFFGMQAPRPYGGAEMDSISYCLVIEEISRVCGAMGLTIAVHNSVVVYPLSQFGNDEQKAKFLPPLATGTRLVLLD